MAGSIIPAIATTNAVIAALMVMEALKLVAGEFHRCKMTFLPKYPNPRKRLPVSYSLLPPNPKCYGTVRVTGGGMSKTLCSFARHSKGQEQTTTVEEHSLKCLAERATRHGRSLSSSSGRLVASLHSAPGGGEDELQLSHCGYSPGQDLEKPLRNGRTRCGDRRREGHYLGVQ